MEKNYEVRMFPMKNVVGVNLGSIIYSADYVRSRREWRYWSSC